MAIVEVQINQANYSVSCNEGDEQVLVALAEHFDNRISSLKEAFGSGIISLTEPHLLVIAALSLADELEDQKKNLKLALDNNARMSHELAKLSDTKNRLAKAVAPAPAASAAPITAIAGWSSLDVAQNGATNASHNAALTEELRQLRLRVETLAANLI